MSFLDKLKKYYQHPFRNEVQGVSSLLLHKIISKLIGTLLTLKYSYKIYESRKRVLKIKTNIKNKKKSVFVFANGPSLKDIDFPKVKKLVDSGEYDIIAVNSFLSKSIESVSPTFAVFADNLHFDKEGKNNQYQQDVDICKKFAIQYFVPFQHFDCISDIQIGYNSICDIFSKNTKNIFSPSGFYGITAFHALRVAKYLNYENIYMCGFDNSYFKDYEVKKNGDMIIRHQHYYDDVKSNTEVPCIYENSSEFFFDTYRHFKYLEKITNSGGNFKNIALNTYMSTIKRSFELDIYK